MQGGFVFKINRVSKAIGAAVPGAGLALTEFLSTLTGVSEDGVIGVSEWYLLAFAAVSALGAYFAPKNAPAELIVSDADLT